MKTETNRRKIVSRLEREGWTNIGGGKHDRFTHPTKTGFVVLPRHDPVSVGVAKTIAKAAGWL